MRHPPEELTFSDTIHRCDSQQVWSAKYLPDSYQVPGSAHNFATAAGAGAGAALLLQLQLVQSAKHLPDFAHNS